jgi:hypothetical protein
VAICTAIVLSRAAARWRKRLLATGEVSKAGLGVLLTAVGAVVHSGLDRSIETALVTASPLWLTDFTTRF